jgi:hypothetical protein
VVNWGSAVPIIVAIIGVSGIAIPAISATFNKPSINIDVTRDIYGPTTNESFVTHLPPQLINLSNNGSAPATNLSLFLIASNASYPIRTITNLLSTVNLTVAIPGNHSLLKVNDTRQINPPTGFIELHVKKFVNGGGSTIRLAVCCSGLDRHESYHNQYYFDSHLVDTVYTTYDQGSTKLYQYPPPLITLPFAIWYFPFIVETSVGFRPTSISSLYLGAVFFYLAQSIVIVYLFYYFFTRMRKQIRKKILKQIVQEMMGIRRLIKNDPLSRKPFHDTRTDNSHTAFDIDDYLRVDDFYSKLAERNSYINSGNTDDIALKKLNNECLDLAEVGLKIIDWGKYK